VIRHVRGTAIDVCGEDHVGIGTDGTISALALTPEYVKRFREDIARRRKLGISAPARARLYLYVPDLNTPRRFETLAAEPPAARTSRDAPSRRSCGGNFSRLFAEVWADVAPVRPDRG
jgi:membrane dipeptidase